MSETMVTVRIPYEHFQQSAKAYLFKTIGDGGVWLPKNCVEIKAYNGIQDLEMPKWLAVQKGLEDLIVAEY